MLLLFLLSLFAVQLTAKGAPSGIPLYAALYQQARDLLHVSDRVSKSLFEEWQETAKSHITRASINELLDRVNNPQPRGRKCHPFHTAKVTTAHVLSVQEFITHCLRNGQSVFCRDVRTFLQDQAEEPISVSKAVVHRLLKGMGYVYTKRRGIKADEDMEPARIARIRQFLIEYSKSLRDENTVICYMDESYINQHHACPFSYVKGDDPTSALHRRSVRGRRLVLVHCITEDGFLRVDDEHTCQFTPEHQPF